MSSCSPRAVVDECRYHCNLNILLGKLRGGGGIVKWADVAALKAELEAQARPAATPWPPCLPMPSAMSFSKRTCSSLALSLLQPPAGRM